MSTAEELAFSIREERRGAHVLLWDDQGDLARALLVFRAALGAVPIEPMLLASTEDAGMLGPRLPRIRIERNAPPSRFARWESAATRVSSCNYSGVFHVSGRENEDFRSGNRAVFV